MTLYRKTCSALLALAIAAALTSAGAGAAEVDKYLPDDTSVVITANVRQILASPLVKKNALELIKQTLKDNADAQKALTALGIDPLKDIDRLVVAMPEVSENVNKGLVIVYGTFDPAKVKATAAELAKKGDGFKIHKAGAYEIYEVKIPDQQQTAFAAVIDKGVVVAGPSKDYVADALAKAAGTKKTVLKKKEVGALIEKVDGKQGLWIAADSSALSQGLPGGADEAIKDFVKKIDAIAGGLTITTDVKAEFVLSAKDAAGATELHRTIGDGINQGLGILTVLAAQQKELMPLVDVVKNIKTSAKDKTVTINANVPGSLIESLLKMLP